VTIGAAQSVPSGRKFKLFDAAEYAGSFASLNLPAFGPAGMHWDTSRLLVDGTVTAIQTGSVSPLLFPVSFTNGTVVIRFASTARLHYVPEVTGSLSPPVRWSAYNALIGTGGIMSVTLPVPPAVRIRFFRLRVY
jgi:hypothetical protein